MLGEGTRGGASGSESAKMKEEKRRLTGAEESRASCWAISPARSKHNNEANMIAIRSAHRRSKRLSSYGAREREKGYDV